MTCQCCDDVGGYSVKHGPQQPATVYETVETIAVWAGVDPTVLLGCIIRDWLAATNLLDLPETAPLPCIDWTHARVLRRRNKTEDSYSSHRRKGYRLTECEPTPPEYVTP